MSKIRNIILILMFWPLVGSAQEARPNVLFILVDDMGWRDLACYGHKIHETPHVDKLASEGMRFTDAYAPAPVCGPSRCAIMTGKFPPNRPYSEPGSAIRIGDWKYLHFYEDGRRELYNLKNDIGESDNLVKRMPEKAAAMKAQLDAMLREHGARIPVSNATEKKRTR